MQFVLDQFKIIKRPLVFDSVTDRYITQELCDKVLSEDTFYDEIML